MGCGWTTAVVPLVLVTGCGLPIAPASSPTQPASTVEGVLSSRGGELGDFDVRLERCRTHGREVELSEDDDAPSVVLHVFEGYAWEGGLPFDSTASTREVTMRKDKHVVATLRVDNESAPAGVREVFTNELLCDAFVGYVRSTRTAAVGGFRLSCPMRGGGRIVGTVVYRCAE
jgi:hypothetical protein